MMQCAKVCDLIHAMAVLQGLTELNFTSTQERGTEPGGKIKGAIRECRIRKQ